MKTKLLFSFGSTIFLSFLNAIHLPGPIVDVKWVKQNIQDVQLINVRLDIENLYTEPKFVEDPYTNKKILIRVGGHIENSFVLDYLGARDERLIDGKEAKFLIPLKEKFIQYIQNSGVNNDKPIIIVPQGDSAPDIFRALRVFWEFKVYGQKEIAFLDGGMAAWLNQSLPYLTTLINHEKGNWNATTYDESIVATTEEVKKLSDTLQSKNGQQSFIAEKLLLDARTPAQFYGTAKRPYISKYGHIPGAIAYSPDLICFIEENIYYLLKEQTYQAIFKEMQLDPIKQAVVYCNTGEMAAGLWFILTQILKNKSVKLYDGSFWLWIHQDMPIDTIPLN